MRARRALMYMPGDEMRKIQKAISLQVDCICMDMEDGVAANRKLEARQTVVEALHSLDFGRSEKLARINPVDSGLELADLQAVLPAHPEGIVLPKAEDPGQVQWVSDQIARAEVRFGWPLGEIGLVIVVETAAGIVNLKSLASSSPRLQALVFGAEDLAGDMGMQRTSEAWEVFYARSALVTHAAAYNLQAIDMVYVNFQDTPGLVRESLQGARMGFTGKQIIHPNQVEPVQAAFTPSAEEISQALHILDVFAQNQQSGKGAFALDGKMVDAPIVKAAERVVSRARAAGKVE